MSVINPSSLLMMRKKEAPIGSFFKAFVRPLYASESLVLEIFRTSRSIRCGKSKAKNCSVIIIGRVASLCPSVPRVRDERKMVIPPTANCHGVVTYLRIADL